MKRLIFLVVILMMAMSMMSCSMPSLNLTGDSFETLIDGGEASYQKVQALCTLGVLDDKTCQAADMLYAQAKDLIAVGPQAIEATQNFADELESIFKKLRAISDRGS